MRIAITASTGLIGSALAQDLERDGAEVRRLVRRPPAADGEIQWNPAAADGGLNGQSHLIEPSSGFVGVIRTPTGNVEP